MAKGLRRIAILDDDKSVREAVARLLKSSGLLADAYAAGMEFINALGSRKPDCLLLDLHMPGMNGLEVMRYLDKGPRDFPIVIITAYDGPSYHDICLEAGAAAYLRKPLDADELLDAISRAITDDVPSSRLGPRSH